MNNKVALILLSSSVLTSCGGGGGEKTSNDASISIKSSSSSSSSSSSQSASSVSTSVNLLKGQFKGINIAGLHYVSGTHSGTTTATGEFTYEEHGSIAFSLGKVPLGSTFGQALLTPINLVENQTSVDTSVQNMVRFLLMLDADGYQENGIQLSTAVRTAANNWEPIDFSSANFEQAMTGVMTAASAADGGTHYLPDAQNAQQHLEKNHWCIRSGIYTGHFNGDSSGKIALVASALTGKVDGFTRAEGSANTIELTGTAPIHHEQTLNFETGSSTNNIIYNASITASNEIAGGWSMGNQYGSIFAKRAAGAIEAIYRFSGIYKGNDIGVLNLDIDSANKVSGVIYDLGSEKSYSLSGHLKGPWLTASADNNTQLQGLLDIDTSTFSGTWTNSSTGTSGTFAGSGCQLNPAPLTISGFDNWKIGFNTGSQQIIPASGTNPLVVMDGAAVAQVRINVVPWGEMSFPIVGFDKTGEAESIDLSRSSFIEITYKANQSVNLQLRQYAVHGGTHNQITLAAAAEFTTIKIPFSDFKGGLTPLDLTKVAKFNFALLSNNTNDGYAELVVKGFKIDKFN